mgnify:CR=1 FL=1
MPPVGFRERSLIVDYLDDAPESNLGQPLVPEPLEVSRTTGDSGALTPVNPTTSAEPAPVDPLLAELLSDDRNLRRRVVGALLRAVLADRRVT